MKTKIVIKWLARILGGLAVIFFGMFIFGEGIPDLLTIESFQLKSMLMLLAFAAFGYFFSWFREKEGGIVMTISGLVMGMNMFYHGGIGDIEAALIYSLPFLIPGLMFWWLGREKVKS